VPARHLVNGTSVLAEACWSGTEYFHLVLAEPETLLAERVPVASCILPSDRRAFGTDGVFDLHPGIGDGEAPTVMADAVRDLLLRRATEAGFVAEVHAEEWPLAPLPAV
jgi:hypothetical protein